MAGMINDLIDILNEQATHYEELLGLSLEKKDVIIVNDVAILQKITNLENMVISQNQKLERKRQSVMKDMASVLNKKVNELDLSALIEVMEGHEEQSALITVRDRIRKTLTALSEVNAHNTSLIQNALDYIEFSVNLIRSAQNPSFYTAKGDRMSADEPGIFDAKH